MSEKPKTRTKTKRRMRTRTRRMRLGVELPRRQSSTEAKIALPPVLGLQKTSLAAARPLSMLRHHHRHYRHYRCCRCRRPR
jgi:hypothetical protein